MSHPNDLALLRERWPDWTITAHWTAAASGPDHRQLVARQGRLVLAARDAADLTAQIEAHEQ